MVAEQDPLVGQTLEGRFLVLSQLGQGGMGLVYVAEDIHLRRRCALKVLRPDLAASIDNVDRFLREAQAIARLSHEHIVNIFSLGRDRDVNAVFFAMELLTGEDLEARLRDPARPVPWREMCEWSIQIARAVGAVHDAGLVHRDLKPGNVFLARRRDGSEFIKLLDFGIVRPEDSEMTNTGATLGTPHYMSPEQVRALPLDRRSDIYAFGILLFRALSGRLPFRGEPFQVAIMHVETPAPKLSEIAPEREIPTALEALVMRALSKDPALRHQSMDELETALRGVLAKSFDASPISAFSLPVRAPTSGIQFGRPQASAFNRPPGAAASSAAPASALPASAPHSSAPSASAPSASAPPHSASSNSALPNASSSAPSAAHFSAVPAAPSAGARSAAHFTAAPAAFLPGQPPATHHPAQPPAAAFSAQPAAFGSLAAQADPAALPVLPAPQLSPAARSAPQFTPAPNSAGLTPKSPVTPQPTPAGAVPASSSARMSAPADGALQHAAESGSAVRSNTSDQFVSPRQPTARSNTFDLASAARSATNVANAVRNATSDLASAARQAFEFANAARNNSAGQAPAAPPPPTPPGDVSPGSVARSSALDDRLDALLFAGAAEQPGGVLPTPDITADPASSSGARRSVSRPTSPDSPGPDNATTPGMAAIDIDIAFDPAPATSPEYQNSFSATVAQEPERRSPLVPAVVALCLLTLLIVISVSLFGGGDESTPQPTPAAAATDEPLPSKPVAPDPTPSTPPTPDPQPTPPPDPTPKPATDPPPTVTPEPSTPTPRPTATKKGKNKTKGSDPADPMKVITKRAKACRRTHKAEGGPKITVDYAVGSNGKVTRAVAADKTALGNCLADAVKQTDFPAKMILGQQISL